MNLTKDQMVDITILDAHGKVMISTEIPVKAGKSYNRIDLNNTSQGVYFIKVLGDKLNTIEKLVVR